MTYEQIQILEKKTKQMHHDFANMLMSVGIVRENFDIWSPEKKARQEAIWQTVYVNALENLKVCLACFDT